MHRRELAAEPDAGQQALFDEGTRVGEIARQRFPGGRLIDTDYWDVKNALRQTAEALADSSLPAIYEGAFVADNTLVRADILHRLNDTDWEMLEVKAVGSPKDIHFLDVAIQVEIARRQFGTKDYQYDKEKQVEAGYPGLLHRIVRCGILHLNKEYIYEGGKYDLSRLFAEYDCSGLVELYSDEVKRLICDGLAVAALPDPPEIAPGEQCYAPYECPFSGTACDLPPVDELSRLPRMTAKKLARLKEEGIFRIEQLDENDAGLSPTQRRAVAAVKSGEMVIDPGLKRLVGEIGYPRMHLDFETFAPALPRYAGTHPFERLPFQYSLHCEPRKGDVIHCGYLHDNDSDPRRPLAETMLEALESLEGKRTECPILTYSSYEKGIIGELAEALPDLRPRLLEVQGRLVDLLPIIRSSVYAPAFGGSFSIKAVLPALVPEAGYADLEIQDGGTASLKYLEMLELKSTTGCKEADSGFRLSPERRGITGNPRLREGRVAGATDIGATDAGLTEAAEKIYRDLWRYCERDTEAMVMLMKRLEAEA